MTRAILYPGAKLFVTSGGKEQSSGILKEKVEEIC
uniref:Terminase large subunit n=1 Tax=Siphoviridae sp. ctxMM9 TaxID=2827973 RepID=A0A8S5T6R2_9CAUD|nr:MAG TPA: terminase large subunit [Siphoviridae sp. ctxMM9]